MTRFQQKRATVGQMDIASDKPTEQRQSELAPLQCEHTPVHRYAAQVPPPGLPLQAHDTQAPPADAGAQGMRSCDTLHAHGTPLVHGVQLSDTTRNDENSDSPIHSGGIVDPNFSQIDESKNITDASFPVISSVDYETDAEFSGMFLYLHDGTLSGNVKKDKPILMMEDRYTIDEDGLLYRVDTPRQKNLARVKPMTKHLCVPVKFCHDMISYVHDNCGHYAAQSLFNTLAARYFWKSMFADAVEYCRTCNTCQRTKINYAHRFAPLHPLLVPEEIGTRFSMDHKVLTRTTAAGNTAVLVIVKCFSGFPHLIPVPDQTADTTAKAIVQHIVSLWGVVFIEQ